MTDKVTIYTSATCPVCDMAKDLLESLDVSYKEVRYIHCTPIRTPLRGHFLHLSVCADDAVSVDVYRQTDW